MQGFRGVESRSKGQGGGLSRHGKNELIVFAIFKCFKANLGTLPFEYPHTLLKISNSFCLKKQIYSSLYSQNTDL